MEKATKELIFCMCNCRQSLDRAAMDHLDLTSHVPVAWLPAGLISWYSQEGTPLALATSWLAIVCGKAPTVLAAWPGRQDAVAGSWRGGDFILNVLTDDCLEKVRQVVRHGHFCIAVTDVFGGNCPTGLAVKAPRLPGCPVQVECRGGIVSDEGFEPELSGEVALLHRGGELFGADAVSKMCAGSLWGRSVRLTRA